MRLIKHAGRPNWYISWTDDGVTKRISTGTPVKADAEAFLRDYISARNAPPSPDQITISEAASYYLNGLPEKKALRQSWSLRPICRHIGHLRVAEITRLVCRQYQNVRLTERPTLSRSTLRDELLSLRTALLFCERENVIDKAPWIEAPTKSEPRERWLTVQEVDKLIAACQRTPHLRLFVMLALCTGARSGAILDLTWDRVDMDRLQIEQGADQEGPGRCAH